MQAIAEDLFDRNSTENGKLMLPKSVGRALTPEECLQVGGGTSWVFEGSPMLTLNGEDVADAITNAAIAGGLVGGIAGLIAGGPGTALTGTFSGAIGGVVIVTLTGNWGVRTPVVTVEEIAPTSSGSDPDSDC